MMNFFNSYTSKYFFMPIYTLLKIIKQINMEYTNRITDYYDNNNDDIDNNDIDNNVDVDGNNIELIQLNSKSKLNSNSNSNM